MFTPAVEALATTNLTERAIAAGWILPDSWTVHADLTYDDATTPDDYTSVEDHEPEYRDHERMIREWFDRGDWGYGIVAVFVQDAHGRDWGRAILGSVEMGTYPNADGTSTFIEPLEDTPGEYSVIREHDLIAEALRDAVRELEAFGDPHGLIREPATNYSGI